MRPYSADVYNSCYYFTFGIRGQRTMVKDEHSKARPMTGVIVVTEDDAVKLYYMETDTAGRTCSGCGYD